MPKIRCSIAYVLPYTLLNESMCRKDKERKREKEIEREGGEKELAWTPNTVWLANITRTNRRTYFMWPNKRNLPNQWELM